MPTIHTELAEFQDEVIALLDSGGFFNISGQFDPVEFYASIPKKAQTEYAKASREKNSRVWDIVKALIVGQAIQAGISAFKQAYPRNYKIKPSAQDYMNRYVKEHGGEFITNMGRRDQKAIVGFIWSNAGKNERPLATQIDSMPFFRSVLDNGRHRTATVVRTEKHRATSYGTSHTAKDNGAKFHIRHEAGDKRTRPKHMAMMGERQPIDRPYSNGEEYPGSNDINCRGWESFEF